MGEEGGTRPDRRWLMSARTMVISLAAVLTLAAAAACGGGATPGDEATPGGGAEPVGPGTNHALGPEGAPVLVVEYADFQ